MNPRGSAHGASYVTVCHKSFAYCRRFYVSSAPLEGGDPLLHVRTSRSRLSSSGSGSKVRPGKGCQRHLPPHRLRFCGRIKYFGWISEGVLLTLGRKRRDIGRRYRSASANRARRVSKSHPHGDSRSQRARREARERLPDAPFSRGVIDTHTPVGRQWRYTDWR